MTAHLRLSAAGCSAGAESHDLHSLGQDQLAVNALGANEADLIGHGIQLVQALEGAGLAVGNPVVIEIAEEQHLLMVSGLATSRPGFQM